jgi:hypothetical protein
MMDVVLHASFGMAGIVLIITTTAILIGGVLLFCKIVDFIRGLWV